MAFGIEKESGIYTCYIILLRINERKFVMFERVSGQNAIIFILALDFLEIVSYILNVRQKRIAR